MKKFLDYDPVGKVQDFVHLDGTGKAVVESIQDCEPVLEYNEEMSKTFDKKSNWWRIGSIPLVTCVEWAKESNTRPFTRDWQEFAKKKLKDPDYAKLNPNRIKF